MKIVDVAEYYADQGGGVKTYINGKLRAGARLGHEVVIVAPGPRDAEEHRHGGRVIWIASRPMPFDPRYGLLLDERAVHSALDAEHPDVVEGSSAWTGGWFVARWRGPAKKSFVFHQDPVAVYPQTFLGGRLGAARVDRLCAPFWAYLRALSRRFDVTVTSGAWLAEKLARFGLERPTAVPFGIEKERFSPARRNAEVRHRWLARCGVPRDAALIVGISRFHPEKRIATLLEAFALARSSRPMGFVLFGGGPMERSVRARAARIAGVHVAGFVSERDELADALASADAFLHGSAAETYGLVIAEALCSGLPVVAPDVGGAADLVDGDCGELYPAGDARACAGALARVLGRDREEVRGGCLRAAQRVRSVEEHFEDLFATYGRLLAE